MASILKFGVKAGILGGAVYYSRIIGIWDNSEVTYELGKNGVAYLTPYINQFEKEVPIPAEIKNLPSSEDICRNVGTYWNRGVISSIAFLERLPSNVSCYIGQGISYVSAQLQQEKIIKSSEEENS